jgi:hypothetical protein
MPTMPNTEENSRLNRNQKKYYAKNADKVNKRARERRRQYPENQKEIRRRAHLKRAYGITPAQYDALFQAQGKICAICETPNPGSKKGWHIDHCHSTRKTRGILCHNCNLTIGHAKDDINRMVAAMFYVLKHKGV